MFFHTYSITELWNYVQSWNFASIAIFVTGVKKKGYNRCEKQLMIVDGKGEFDQDIFKYHEQTHSHSHIVLLLHSHIKIHLTFLYELIKA
jgi:uncharacterized protein YjlB